jgi:hypothetical protein
MRQSLIEITFSAVNLEGVSKYAALVQNNVDHVSAYYYADEKFINGTDGSRGSYAIGTIGLVVEDEKLNNCLVQLDSVEAGFVPDAEEVLEEVFGDARYEVSLFDEEVPLGIMQMNQYLHNKVQEQTRSIAILEAQMSQLIDLCADTTAQSTGMKVRYDNLQAYIHSYLNVNGLVDTVRRIAEEVDPDILDDYQAVKIH